MDSAQIASSVVRFGVFEADLRARELRKSGSKVRLQDLPFRALTLLLSRPGELITHEEFRKTLWEQGVFVDFERALRSAIKRLRDALGDNSDNPIFVETVERRGYRWIAPVHSPEPPSKGPQEKESVPVPATVPASVPPTFFSWRRAIFVLVLPVLAVFFAVSIFRSGSRGAKAGASLDPVTAAARHQPTNREAEELYLKGRFYWNKRTPESLKLAMEDFNQAIARDPNYSDAYVGLADCYNLLREFSAMPANDAYFKAFAAAKKAVELDPQSPEANATLGFVSFWGMWDAADAEREFRRAIELDPMNARAHHWLATFLSERSRHEESLKEIEVARKLDPNSKAILADQAELLRCAGHRDEALEILKQLEATEPDFVSPHRYLRYAYFSSGDFAKYIIELKKEALLTHDPAKLSEAEAAARGLAAGGATGLLESQLAEQKKLYEQRRLSPFLVAQTEARLGNKREALRYLKLCVQAHDEMALDLGVDQAFLGFRGDPVFEQLLAQIGLLRG